MVVTASFNCWLGLPGIVDTVGDIDDTVEVDNDMDGAVVVDVDAVEVVWTSPLAGNRERKRFPSSLS